MNPDILYGAMNSGAFVAWLVLMIVPRSARVRRTLNVGVVTAVALLYAVLFATTFDPAAFGEFATLSGLMALFASPWAVVMGWAHYLAFDLLVGLRIARDADETGMNPLALLPFLLGAFMAGPLGWLAYGVFRTIRLGRPVSEM